MKKTWSCKFLLALSIAAVFLLSFSHARAEEYEIPGSVFQMLESNGVLYLKTDSGSMYHFDPNKDAQPVLFAENVPDEETLVVAHGKPYLHKNAASGTLELFDAAQSEDAVQRFDLFPGKLPFEGKDLWISHNISFEDFLIMSIAFDGSDDRRLCRYDFKSGVTSICKSYVPSIESQCYAFSPVSTDETLYIRRVPTDPSAKESDYISEVVLYNWLTEKDKVLATLPARAHAFAHERAEQLLYYFHEHSLFSLHLPSGDSTEIQKIDPKLSITVQNASILDGRKLCFITQAFDDNSDGSDSSIHYSTLHVWTLR